MSGSGRHRILSFPSGGSGSTPSCGETKGARPGACYDGFADISCPPFRLRRVSPQRGERRWAPLGLCLLLTLGACTVGPNYHKPEEPTPTGFLETPTKPPAAGETRITPEEGDLSAWWTSFGDPLLDELIRRALADNKDIATAESRLREARRQETVAVAAGLPHVNATGSAVTYNSNHAGTSSSSGSGNSSSSGVAGLPIPSHFNLYAAGFDATWEVDLFGGVRRSVEAARANTEAALWARRDMDVSLSAEVANDYLTLRALQARIAVGQAELARQRDLFSLIRARREAGFVTNLDVNQQTAQVETAAAQIPQLEAQSRAQIHALGVLVGQAPEYLAATLAPTTALPGTPPSLPLGLPSDLLRRRPDVREAERRLAAANAEIGVQTANLYPKLNLLALANFSGMDLGSLFSRSNLASAAAGMATAPIFDAGKTRANIAIAREEAVQARLAYETTILNALRDVEDALARHSAESVRVGELAASVDAARNSLAIAQDQYRTGLVTFINVLQAENTLLNAEDQLVQSRAQIATDLGAIYKALGGGWAEGPGEDRLAKAR